MTHTPARHLIFKGRVACGQPNPRRTTTDPARVTCVRCRSTITIADAEAHLSSRRLSR